MIILVYGAGVQGSYLAHSLVRSGNDVTILARGDRACQIRNDGIVIRHYFQRKTTVDNVKVVETLDPNDEYDLILVSMKYSDFPLVLDALAANKSKTIVMIGNNLSAKSMEDHIVKASNTRKNVLFGFQMNGGKRESDRIICIRFGKGQMKLGALDGDSNRLEKVRDAFDKNFYKIDKEPHIDDWLKSHSIQIMPMNAATYLHNNDFQALSKDNQLLKKMVDAMNEGYDILTEAGYQVIPRSLMNFSQKHKHAAYLFYKLFNKLPMTRLIDGSANEIAALYTEFDKIKAGADTTSAEFDFIQKKFFVKRCQNPAS